MAGGTTPPGAPLLVLNAPAIIQSPKHYITKEQHNDMGSTGTGRKPDERTRKMLAGLLEGKAPTRAAIDAGYSWKTAKVAACKMARSLKMKQAMLEYAKGIRPGELGDIAKVLVQNQLTNGSKYTNAKEQLGYIRTALELDGQLGGPSELHLHQHSSLPPRVQKMLEDKMAEILALKASSAEEGMVLNVQSTDARDEESTQPQGERCAGENQKDDGGI